MVLRIGVSLPFSETMEHRADESARHIHRADLHRGLLDAAVEAGCEIHLNSRVVSIDAQRASLATKSGVMFEADLIVASDGILSPSLTL